MAVVAVAATALYGGHSSAATAGLSGKAVFEQYCIHCHGPGGEQPGTLQLGKTRGKDKALLAERTDLPPAYVVQVVRAGLRSMPPFAPADLDDAKLAALAQYLGKSTSP